MLRIKRNESQSCLTVIAFSKNNILISGDLWVTPCSGNCKTTSYFNTMLPAVVVFFFLYGHFYYYSYYYHFMRHFCSLCHYLSVQFQLYSLFFSLRYESRLWWYFFSYFTDLRGFLWAVLDILHGLISHYVFFCYLYICLSSCVDCFDGIKHSFASIQLNAFSMANWAPQSRVLISRSTHPSSCSFLSPSVWLASGVNCTVKT